MRRLTLMPLALLALGACRGQPSELQPIHLVPDMDYQPKFSPEEETPLFPDGRTMRPIPGGAVAVGSIDEDEGHFTGKVGAKFLARVPLKVNEALLRRGRERFGIYCTPCHDMTGSGHGMVVQRGYPPPIDLTSKRVVEMPDGNVFHTITNGVRNMPSYRKQIPVDDRWAIVAWVRVLDRSQNATIDDVPTEKRSAIEPEAGAPK